MHGRGALTEKPAKSDKWKILLDAGGKIRYNGYINEKRKPGNA
jgi:hypothetical protein